MEKLAHSDAPPWAREDDGAISVQGPGLIWLMFSAFWGFASGAAIGVLLAFAAARAL